MKRKLTATLAMMSLAFFAATAQNADENLSWDIYPDTWVGTDGAGRIQPTQAETGKTNDYTKRQHPIRKCPATSQGDDTP